MGGGRCYLPQDDIVPPPAEDMIDDIREKLGVDRYTRHPKPSSFKTTKTGFKKFE
jgi:hypothetical protein